MIKDDSYFKNVKSRKFKSDNYTKGDRKRGWIKNTKNGYNPYENWLETRSGIDPLDGEAISDDETPWAQTPLSEKQEDQLDALEEVYPKLKRRQKELVNLLFRGYTSQAAIAFMMQITPQQVTQIITSLRKKIEKRIQQNER